jgi:hypothetical protein
MAKFFGSVGYVETKETAPGVWTEEITERKYRGDVTRNTKKWSGGENQNDDLDVSVTISVVADAYANEHFFAIRYVTWMGAKWKVTTVEPSRPRLILTLGGVYNGFEQ